MVAASSDAGLSSCMHEVKFTETAQARLYKFGDFFAGIGGLSSAMEYAAQSKVQVHMTVDGFAGQWNILHDEDFAAAKLACESVLDHGHFAPPCRTLTKARRTDKFGSAVLPKHLFCALFIM